MDTMSSIAVSEPMLIRESNTATVTVNRMAKMGNCFVEETLNSRMLVHTRLLMIAKCLPGSTIATRGLPCLEKKTKAAETPQQVGP